MNGKDTQKVQTTKIRDWEIDRWRHFRSAKPHSSRILESP